MGTAMVEQLDDLKVKIHFVRQVEEEESSSSLLRGALEPSEVLTWVSNAEAHHNISGEGDEMIGLEVMIPPSSPKVFTDLENVVVKDEEEDDEQVNYQSCHKEEVEEEQVDPVKNCRTGSAENPVTIHDDEDDDKDRKSNDKRRTTATNGSITSSNEKKKLQRDDNLACTVCGKTFTLRWNLVAHMRIHTDERPYPCPSCSNKFRQYAHLKKHMEEHFLSIMRGLHPGVPMPSPNKVKGVIPNLGGPGCSFPLSKNKKMNKVKKRIMRRPVASSIPLRRVVVTPDPVPEDPYKKFNLRNCQVPMSRWDVDDNQPMDSSLLLQKLNNMVSHKEPGQDKDLSLAIEAHDGRKCIVKMDTDLLAHFLQPMDPPPPSPTPRITVGMYLEKFYPSQQQQPQPSSSSPPPVRTKKPGPKSKTLPLSPPPSHPTTDEPVKRGRGRPKGSVKGGPRLTKSKGATSLGFKCNKCPRRVNSQNALRIHNIRYHSEFKKGSNKGISSESPTLGISGSPVGISEIIDRNTNGLIVKQNAIGKGGPLACTQCGRRFQRLDVLKKHMQIHNGERPQAFQCPTCSKFFLSKSYLISHTRIHTGEKPYGCKVCGKRFTRGDTLQTHMRLHTGEKPYQCPICTERFIQLSRLHAHTKKYHPGEVACVKCSVCSETFPDEASLAAHSVIH